MVRFNITAGQAVDPEAEWAIMNEKSHAILSNARAKISRHVAIELDKSIRPHLAHGNFLYND